MASPPRPLPSKFLTLQSLSRKDPQLLIPTNTKPGVKTLIKNRIKALTNTQSVSTPASPDNSPKAKGSGMRSTTFLTSSRGNDSFAPAVHYNPDLTILSSPRSFNPSPSALKPCPDPSPLPRPSHLRSVTQAQPRPSSLVFKHFAIQPRMEGQIVEVENVVTRCAFKTRTGAILSRPKKHNQDAYIIAPLLGQVRGQYLFSICDGHGSYGHHVSRFIKDSLPRLVGESLWPVGPDNPQEKLTLALLEGFRKTAAALQKAKVDVTLSGSTCVSIAISGRILVCANVGDSRAILIRKNGARWSYEALSTDHKPSLSSEYQRIVSCGGRVSPYREANGDPVGPARVWIGQRDVPGLAMSRAIGDSLATQAGVISIPETKGVQLSEQDKAIVLGSDGLWEFLSCQEVADAVGERIAEGDLEGTCEKLVKEAVVRWRREDDVVDDITLIVIYLRL